MTIARVAGPGQPLDRIEQEIRRFAAVDPGSLQPPVSDAARDELKFAECLPVELAEQVVQERLGDPMGVAGILVSPARIVIADQA
jgi:hypothetical protein